MLPGDKSPGGLWAGRNQTAQRRQWQEDVMQDSWGGGFDPVGIRPLVLKDGMQKSGYWQGWVPAETPA